MLPAIDSLTVDQQIFLVINNRWEHGWLDPVMIAATQLADPFILIAWMIPFLFILERRQFKRNFFLFISSLLGALIAGGLPKYFIHKDRPLKELQTLIESGAVHVHVLLSPQYEGEFPSGHVARIFAVGILFLFFYRRAGAVLICLGLLTALSRIYVGAHYPSDVIGGIMAGMIIAVFIYRFYSLNYYKVEERNSHDHL